MNIDILFRIAAIGILVTVISQILTRAGREDMAMLATLRHRTRARTNANNFFIGIISFHPIFRSGIDLGLIIATSPRNINLFSSFFTIW